MLHLLTAVPLALHAWLLHASVFASDGIYLGVGVSVSVIIWLAALIYWIGGFFYRLEALQVFVAGLRRGAGAAAPAAALGQAAGAHRSRRRSGCT